MSRLRLLWICVCLASIPRAAAQDDVVLRAMKDELSRSTKQLRLPTLDRPYFISYLVNDLTTNNIVASLGGLTSSDQTRARLLTVEVRVGDYNFDNTNFLSSRFGGVFKNSEQLPLDDDYKEIRRHIWLATDGAFKRALDELAQKRAAIENKTGRENIPDLSKEDATTTHQNPASLILDAKQIESLVRQLSAIFRSAPEITRSSITLESTNEYQRYINSEGTEYTRAVPYVGLIALASTQAPDGMPLSDSFAIYGHSLAALPAEADLNHEVQHLSARLTQLRAAPLAERYNGPVLLEGQASAEIFLQNFASRITASHQLVTDNPQSELLFSRFQSPLQERVGARVLPEWAGLVDDPGLRDFNKSPLLGGYAVDSDGVRARRNVVVENGILKTLLTSRAPVRGIPHSTGNNGSFGVAPSNLTLAVKSGLSDAELKQKLLSLALQRGKPYAIVIRRIHPPMVGDPSEVMASVVGSILPGFGGGNDNSMGSAVLAYQVFPDGHEVLVRNAQLGGINVGSFKDVVAASTKMIVYSAPFLDIRSVVLGVFSGGGITPSRPPLVSLVMPDLLLEDATVNPPSGQITKPPLSERPELQR